MKLRRCLEHNYTLSATCPICKKPTIDAHYKFVKIRPIKENSPTS